MKRLIIPILLIATALGCKKFDDLNSNPNATEKVTPEMLATGLILNVTEPVAGKTFALPHVLSKMLVWGENGDEYQYNYFGRTSLNYGILTNVEKMIDQASDEDKNAYTGLGHFIKAYKLFYNSLDVGDIPYSDALKGEEGNTSPKYDLQKEVMKQVLADLATAEQAFANAGDFGGDPVFDGNSNLWRKTVNAFRLKVLLHLSKKADDPDLQIKQTFATIVQQGALMKSNADNFQLVFSDKANQMYPFNKTLHKFTEYPMITGFLIDSLKKMNDYRLFYYANPSKYEIEVNKRSDDDWDAYPGVDPAAVFSSLKSLWSQNKFCLLNLRYTDYAPGEPLVYIGYAEQNFMLAEAIARGWITGDANQYYKEGIRAAMEFVADHTPDNRSYNHNRKITSAYIDTYLAGPFVTFSSNPEQQIRQILQQKYFMRFMQNPYEAYYEYRRTHYPNWPINPNTNLNEVKDQIPVRWMYPTLEYARNEEHVKEAVERQFGGQDTPNEVMWLLK